MTEWRQFWQGRDQAALELTQLRQEVVRLRAVSEERQGEVDELRTAARALVSGATVSNTVARLRAGVGAVVAASVEGAVARMAD